MITLFVFILSIALKAYDDYLYERGYYLYSVIIGIKGDDDDSIDDVRVYANDITRAKTKAMMLYSKENGVTKDDLIIFIIEKVK